MGEQHGNYCWHGFNRRQHRPAERVNLLGWYIWLVYDWTHLDSLLNIPARCQRRRIENLNVTEEGEWYLEICMDASLVWWRRLLNVARITSLTKNYFGLNFWLLERGLYNFAHKFRSSSRQRRLCTSVGIGESIDTVFEQATGSRFYPSGLTPGTS